MGLPTVARGRQDGAEVWLRVDGELELHKDLEATGSSVRVFWGIESPLPALLGHVLTPDERVWLEWFVEAWKGKVG